MTEQWLSSHSDEQAAERAGDFWSALRDDVDAGTFWADRIKQYRDEPGKRLQLAMENLPLPAAFGEASVALRAIIRTKRKAGEEYEEELGLLYWLAAVASFSLPYAERLKEPGFNVIEAIPGERLRSLPIDYMQLGYEELGLLKTDRKWLVEAWGEPEKHQTLNQMHRWLWDKYEDKLIEQRQAEREKFRREMQELLHSGSSRLHTRDQGQKRAQAPVQRYSEGPSQKNAQVPSQKQAQGAGRKAGCLGMMTCALLIVAAVGTGIATLLEKFG